MEKKMKMKKKMETISHGLCDFCLDMKDVAYLYWQRICQACFNDLFTTPEEHECEVCGKEKAKTIFAADLFICADCVLKLAKDC